MKKNRFFLLLVVIYMTSFYSCNVDEDLNDTIVEVDLKSNLRHLNHQLA